MISPKRLSQVGEHNTRSALTLSYHLCLIDTTYVMLWCPKYYSGDILSIDDFISIALLELNLENSLW